MSEPHYDQRLGALEDDLRKAEKANKTLLRRLGMTQDLLALTVKAAGGGVTIPNDILCGRIPYLHVKYLEADSSTYLRTSDREESE